MLLLSAVTGYSGTAYGTFGSLTFSVGVATLSM